MSNNNSLYLKLGNTPKFDQNFFEGSFSVGVSADWWVSIFVHRHLLHLHSIQFACNNVVTIPPGLPDITKTVILWNTSRSQAKSFSFKWGDRPSFFMLILATRLWFFPGMLKFWSRPWVLLLLKVGGQVCLGTQEAGSLPPRHKIACLMTTNQSLGGHMAVYEVHVPGFSNTIDKPWSHW